MAKEKDYYARITKYYEKNAKNSICWEAKLSKSGRLPFAALAPHQEEKLLKAQKVHGEKIPDVGLARKSFDGFVLHRATSVVILIYFGKNSTEVYEISIRTFLNEKYTSKEKSLTKMRAAEIGTRIYL